MPRNPDKKPCQEPGCRAWAVRGSDPPLCASHAGRNVGAGAPLANQNRRTHGFYASVLTRQEAADLVAFAADTSLDAEIACARISLRRVMTLLLASDKPQPDTLPVSIEQYTRLAALALQAARTIARLLSIKSKLGESGPDSPMAAIGAALDELSAEWGVEL